MGARFSLSQKQSSEGGTFAMTDPAASPPSAIPPRTTGGGFRWSPPTTAELQAQLPNYTVVSLLGHGGMGAVYRAIQSGLDRPVAIKILPPGIDLEDPTYAERFKNEARTMARLDHPGIVPVYECGQTPGGLLYFVMAFIDGTDVHQMLRAAPQRRLPPEHALAITAHICDALSYAHSHGVIHRDIKPANILIDTVGRVKIADFGLAKIDDPADRGFTKTGLAMGTPDYVAPEALILGEKVDGRADLYAVGVMLYQMLTGEVPRGAFKPVSQKIPGLDPRFDGLIETAMQTDRDDRFPTSTAMRTALDPLLFAPLTAAELATYTTGMAKQAIPMREAAKPRSRKALHLGLSLFSASALALALFIRAERAGQAPPPPAVPPSTAAAPRDPERPSSVMQENRPRSAPASAKADVATTANSTAAKKESEVSKGPSKDEGSPPAVSASGPPESTAQRASASATAIPAAVPPAPAPVAKASAPPTTAPSSAAPSAPISNPQSQISNAAPAAFPPGQWVKVFTKFEDLPERLRKPDSGVKIENGKLIIAARSSQSIKFPTEFSNVGLRLKQAPNSPETQVRLSKSDTTDIRLLARPSGDEVSCMIWKPGAGNGLGNLEAPRGLERTLELVVVGRRVVARVNDQIFGAELPTGEMIGPFNPEIFFNNSSVRDVEVINLDGIPEAEALRILGIDEKGNDTRAAALATEKQAMEQKQVAQAAAGIPELAALDEQFKKLTAERVTAPFEADLAKLNSGYLGGIDRKIAEERGKGNLDGVLALEEEKKLIVASSSGTRSQGPDGLRLPTEATTGDVPATDTETTPATLKGLRQIYREAFAKLHATRAANLKLLTDPLSIRLRQLESTLTQANRIEHAKTVREYREQLASDPAPVEQREITTPAPPASTKVKIKPNPEKSRAAAEYALAQGCIIEVSRDENMEKRTTVNPGQPLPEGKWQLYSVFFPKTRPLTDADLEAITQAIELRGFRTADYSPDGTFTTYSHFAKTPTLETLHVASGSKTLSPEEWQTLGKLGTSLRRLSITFDFAASRCPEMYQAMAALQALTIFTTNAHVDDDFAASLARLENLQDIALSPKSLTDASAASFAALPRLNRLLLRSTADGPSRITALFWSTLAKTHGSKISAAGVGMKGCPQTSGIVQVLARDYRHLTDLRLLGEVTAEALAELSGLRKLEKLAIEDYGRNAVPEMTLAHAEALGKFKALTDLKLEPAPLMDEHVRFLTGIKDLRVLRMHSSDQITDACIPALLEMRDLTELAIQRTRITPAGVVQLGALKKLKLLDATSLSLSDADFAQLKAALPGCHIYR